MKTTNEVLEEISIKEGYTSFKHLLLELDLEPNDVTSIVCVGMKAYAKQCAEQALKDAANEMEIWAFKDEDIFYSAKESILSTPVLTP